MCNAMNACSIASDTTSLRQDPMWAFDSVVPNHLFQSEWHGPSRSLKPYSRMVAPYYVFRERIIGPRLPSDGTVVMQVISSMACSPRESLGQGSLLPQPNNHVGPKLSRSEKVPRITPPPARPAFPKNTDTQSNTSKPHTRWRDGI